MKVPAQIASNSSFEDASGTHVLSAGRLKPTLRIDGALECKNAQQKPLIGSLLGVSISDCTRCRG